MIRILHTIDTTGPGGAETVFINLVKGLDKNRFYSIAAIKGPGWVCDTLRSNGIEPIFIPAKGGFNIQYLYRLIRIIRDHKIDVIQSHLLGSNLYCSLAGLICRVPVVSTFHGFVDTSGLERLVGLKFKILNLGSSQIVFVSDKLREHYTERYGVDSQKSMTIYNGVDTSVFFPKKDSSLRTELNINKQHILIGAVGNIRPAKGYDVFLKAAQLIYKECPHCRFLIAGQGSGDLYDSLLSLRKDLDLEHVFHMVGFKIDTARVLNNFDIFVLPSTSEGFSISTIEAMSCGLPVVVTRSGGPEEIVVNGINGMIVECDKEILANAIIECIKNKSMSNSLSKNASLYVLNNFNIMEILRKYEIIYSKLQFK